MLGAVVGAGAGAGPGRGAGGRQVHKVADQAGGDEAREGPHEGGRPERGRDQQEHVGEGDGVVGRPEEAHGGDGEGVAGGQDLLEHVVQLDGVDDVENRRHGGQGLARSIGSLGETALVVDGRDPLAHSVGRPVN